MIIRNKTGHTQSVYLKDGSIVSARPYRSITIDDTMTGLDTKVWEVEGKQEVKVEPQKSTKKGN